MSDPHQWAGAEDRDWLPELERRLAAPGKRIAASLLDGAVVFTPVIAIAAIMGFEEASETVWFIVVSTIWAAVYDIGFIAARGATVGKRILGIEVARQVDGAVPPGLETAIKRWLVNMVGLVPWLFAFSVGITAASTVLLFVDLRRRAIHDRIAGTYVVNR